MNLATCQAGHTTGVRDTSKARSSRATGGSRSGNNQRSTGSRELNHLYKPTDMMRAEFIARSGGFRVHIRMSGNSVGFWSREASAPNTLGDAECEKDDGLSKKSVSVERQLVVRALNSRSGHYSIPEEP
jgi:hypothetical protein